MWMPVQAAVRPGVKSWIAQLRQRVAEMNRLYVLSERTNDTERTRGDIWRRHIDHRYSNPLGSKVLRVL
jgi:hypothetical protein